MFFRYNATMPFTSDAVWSLTQMRRWGQIAEPQTDEWFAETAASVYRPDIYLHAAQLLIDEGLANAADFPFGYIDSLPIGLKSGQTVVGGEVQG